MNEVRDFVKMKSRKSFAGVTVLLVLASLVILIAGVREAQSLLVPIVFAFFLATLAVAPLEFFERLRVPKVIAIIFMTLSVVGIFSSLIVVFSYSVDQFVGSVPRFQERLGQWDESIALWFRRYGFDWQQILRDESLDAGQVADFIAASLKNLVNALSSGFIVMVLTIFMIVEAAEFRAKMYTALGESIDISRLEGVATDIQRYLGIKTVTSALTGVVMGVFTACVGVSFPLLWGLLAFLFNYIPFVGSILASIPAVVLAFSDLGVSAGILVICGYTAMNLLIGNLVEPVLMGRRLGLSPLVVFLSLFFWGWVWGTAGMLLSVPLTMLIKIFLDHSRDFRWIADLMGRRPIE